MINFMRKHLPKDDLGEVMSVLRPEVWKTNERVTVFFWAENQLVESLYLEDCNHSINSSEYVLCACFMLAPGDKNESEVNLVCKSQDIHT